jgi:hypothetical protein
MDVWNNTVRQFYAEKIATNALHLEDIPFNVVPVNVPSGVLDAYNYFGGEDSDPQPEFHTFKVEEQDTYAVILTWGGGDGYLALLDHQGQLLGAAYVANEDDVNSIKWYDSLPAAMAGG